MTDPLTAQIITWLGPPQPQLQQPVALSTHNRINHGLVQRAVQLLKPSGYPLVVFGRLAELLASTGCDRMWADIYVAERLARWQQTLTVTPPGPATRRSMSIVSQAPHGWSATIFAWGPVVASDSGGNPEYVASLHCYWSGSPPSKADVMAIEQAATSATHIVSAAQTATAAATTAGQG